MTRKERTKRRNLGLRSTSAALLALGWLLASGCGDDSTAEKLRVAKLSEGCLINSDCQDPLVCAFKRCHDACTTSRDCPTGQRCLASDRPFHVCQLPDETDCIYHSDCPPSLVCGADKECRDQCTTHRDCLDEQSCTQGTCADDTELVDGKLPGSGGDDSEPQVGQPCSYTSDCTAPLLCRGGLCRLECQDNRDCATGATCIDGVCDSALRDPNAPAHCSTRGTDGDETDVDCGGACAGCRPGGKCAEGGDCSSLLCEGDVCQVPSCADGQRNGTESDVDCGGPSCDPCTQLAECSSSSECASDEVCKRGQCRAGTCGNGALDADETDIDCGGPDCPPCDHLARCNIDGDCTSLSCEAGSCATPTCNDGVPNGTETGVDCGGASCGLCADGVGCDEAEDCASGVCDAGMCQAPDCEDGAQNGWETDQDCGGVLCDACGAGNSCRLDGDCAAGKCLAGVCTESFTLSVVKAGTGQGSVSSTNGLVQCGSSCSASFGKGTNVTLTAQPVSGFAFAGWSGACSGFGVCVVAMNSDLEVTATFGQPQTGTEWAVNLTGTTGVYPAGLTSDGSGNAYVTGYMTGTVDFGKGDITAQGTDAYAAKYDSSGALAWVTRLGGANQEFGEDIAVSADGNQVFVLGHLPTAGANEFGGALTGCSASSKTIVKLDASNGAPVSASCFGAGTSQSSYSSSPTKTTPALVRKANGNLAFTAEIFTTQSFGSFSLQCPGGRCWALGEVSASDLTVLKASAFANTGNGSSVAPGGPGIVSHPSDGTLVSAGWCYGLGVAVEVPGQRTNAHGVCVLKLEDGLAPIWGRVFNTTALSNNSWANSAAIAANADVVVGGQFNGTLSYGGTGVNNTASVGDYDGFVVRLKASDGSPLWARSFGSAGFDRVSGVAVDWTTGNIAIVGEMSGALDFGDGPLPYTSGTDLFFVLLDESGNTLDSRAAGLDSATPEYATALVAKPAGGFLFLGRSAGIGASAFGLTSTTLDYTFLSNLQ
jgi:hypothetical protein